MRLIHYVEIENFKRFSDKQRIELDHPSVLIGPNNCGKTSALEAIVLWSQAVRLWHKEKVASSPKTRPKTWPTTWIQRLQPDTKSILHAQHFWHNSAVRKDDQAVLMTITVGLQHNNTVEPVTMHFRSGEKDRILSTLNPATRNKLEVFDAAAKLDVSLLYPISRFEAEEPILQPRRIGEMIRKEQTAQVFRNICLLIYKKEPEVWEKIVDKMHYLFSVEIHHPLKNSRGTVDLLYKQNGATVPLDISFSGQGFQQVLLILTCLYSNSRNVLLIDEPDTHLEILRQKQIYTLLRNIANKTESQIVLTTHSETLIDEGLHDGNLTLLLGQRSENLADKKDVQNALKYYNAPHYLRARRCGHILYLEGNTDFDILHELAKKLNHPVAQSWSQLINLYFVRDNNPEPDMDSELERVEGGFGIKPKKHFFALHKLVPGLRGLVILDGDTKNREDTKNQLSTSYWKRYEIESYFITRELLLDSVQNHCREFPLPGDLKNHAPKILDKLIQERIFDDNPEDFNIWKETSSKAQRLVWEGKATIHKLSALAEEFYEKLADAIGGPVLYRKGRFYELIDLVEPESIPKEITEKLDLIQDLLENSSPQE